MTDDYVSAKHTARRPGVTERTLRRWRAAGTGPAWIAFGGRVRYGLDDIARWMADQRREP